MDSTLTLLVDASSLIYRALFSVPDTIRAKDGTPMNAAYGFLEMLGRLITDRRPDFVACAADEDWRPQWRVDLIESYKAIRAEEGSAQEAAELRLAPQTPVIELLLEGMGVPVLGRPDYEAEDVIGSLAERAPGRVGIVSGDRDLFQLVKDPKIFVLYPKRGVSVVDVVDESYIEDRYGIPGRAYRDFAILRGDPSDGLPGVRGIGDKLAASLITRYGSLEGILEAIDAAERGSTLEKVRLQRDYVERALKVVTIPTDLALPDVDMAATRPEPQESLYAAAQNYALEGPVRRLAAALSADGDG
jgi:5'-3' exonuclease